MDESFPGDSRQVRRVLSGICGRPGGRLTKKTPEYNGGTGKNSAARQPPGVFVSEGGFREIREVDKFKNSREVFAFEKHPCSCRERRNFIHIKRL